MRVAFGVEMRYGMRVEVPMDRRFLLMVSAISGGVMIVALLLLPVESWGDGELAGSWHAVQYPTGGFLLIFTWLAGGFSTAVMFKMNERVGLSEYTCRLISLLGFKLAGFFLLAMLIGGTLRGGGFGAGYWLAFIAAIVGALSLYLTFNEKLAQRIADAAKEKGAGAGDEKGDAPADAADGAPDSGGIGG
jgi:hypothetical protein